MIPIFKMDTHTLRPIHTYIHTYIHVFVLVTWEIMSLCIFFCIFKNTHVHICIDKYACVCAFIRFYMYVHVNI